MISENLSRIKDQIAVAAQKAGHEPGSVRLVAVTKTVADEKILAALKAGAEIFGENRVQEALGKIDRLGREGVEWHFIGHLQKNKVRQIVARFDLIHSVDSVALAKIIGEKSRAEGRITRILIQVNVCGEASKFGVPPEELEDTLRAVATMQGVRIEGLMTIPPLAADSEKSRSVFSSLRRLRDQMAGLGIQGVELKELSMGMSNDFPVAIQEGATLVRVGTAIFGDRAA